MNCNPQDIKSIKIIIGSIILLPIMVFIYSKAIPPTDKSPREQVVNETIILVGSDKIARIECEFDSSSPNRYQSKKNIEGPAEITFSFSQTLQTIKIVEMATDARIAYMRKECSMIISDSNAQAVSQCVQSRISRLKDYSIIAKDVCALVVEN